ncbi:MAG: cytochrome c3 family protein [Planctomycetia bacterium]|nr:cytochrome c3 family protein [Planctomycetia bacterium]
MPRSPARDLSDRYTGSRGYFQQSDAIRRGKYALMGVGLLVVGVWAAVDINKPERAAYAHTHGPLAEAHAAFDENCAACHVSQTPDHFSAGSMFDARQRWHTFTCERCHGGPIHHTSMTDEGKQFHATCSNCHHDHNGRMNSLVRISDSHCTKCHANLASWHATGSPYYAQKVTNFVTDHPEFRALTKPPERTLTFSHAVHMTAGQLYEPNQRGPWTIGDIRRVSGDAMADRYLKPGQTDASRVQLECASCHQLDANIGTDESTKWKESLDATGQPTRALLPPRAEGAYFLGINYNAHCQACHPLTAPAKVTTKDKSQFLVPEFRVTHRLQQPDLMNDLKAGYFAGLLVKNPAVLKAPIEPGGIIDTEVDRLAKMDVQTLLTGHGLDKDKDEVGCVKCHKTTVKESIFRIEPVPDRTVWFEHAKFNHTSHRAVDCLACHPGTAAAPIPKSKADETEPVQIVSVKWCQTCHSPPNTRITLPDQSVVAGGGVRHTCTDCHRYHNGDHGFQGLGARPRLPSRPLTLSEFLKGK